MSHGSKLQQNVTKMSQRRHGHGGVQRIEDEDGEKEKVDVEDECDDWASGKLSWD